ncbi:unnamed protein product [Adineta ricciae]|uniref:Uncharacterized protein n=1 Tax=Adineta ricciae TaxID=249248 RepID=A0A815VD24_ADIRI|nr:unnamed protein product [Adineta ricciae]CAF1676098.1 unnamed protein product [Adineta ricciae]
MRFCLFLVTLRLVVYAQFNLNVTDRIVDTDFDCLHYYVPSEVIDMQLDVSIKQVIKYCIRPTNDQFSNFEENYYQNPIFEQLCRSNVTIEDLLSWSASVDSVEQYSI